MSTDNQSAQSACINTDRELWRAADDYYAPSIHVTEGGSIGINVGGFVIVAPVEKWHAALAQAPAPSGEAPDMPAICAALGFDPTNHHNAAKCPYCRPATLPTPEQAGPSGEAKPWPEGYCLDPNGRMCIPEGKAVDWHFGYDIGFAEAWGIMNRAIAAAPKGASK